MVSDGVAILPNDGRIFSNNKRFQLVMQRDGNLVVYFDGNPLWSTGTSNKGSLAGTGNWLAMQTDANLVIYDSDNKPVWWPPNIAGTGRGPFKMIMQDDGNLVIYDSVNAVIWASHKTVQL